MSVYSRKILDKSKKALYNGIATTTTTLFGKEIHK